jgi:hypothetical protein
MHHFVIAPIIAAKLHHVIDLAHRLSISALNAKVITARSGEQSRALRPLTNHITENTTEILDVVYKITEYSINSSFATIKMQRTEKNLDQFKAALKMHGKPHEWLEDMIATTQAVYDLEQKEYNDRAIMLVKMLKQLSEITKTFNFISINCSIEASHVPAIEKDFAVVANVLKDAGIFIHNILTECFELLSTNKK